MWLDFSKETTKGSYLVILMGMFFHTLHEQPETKQLFPFKSIEISEVNPVVDLTISADNRLIAWSTNNGKVYLYDVVKDTFQN